MQTYGERKVDSLLKELRRTNQFFHIPEFQITSKTAYQKPDFVVVASQIGVIVVEVKDWVNVLEFKQGVFKIKRRDGTITNENNPLRTAEQYGYGLKAQFEKREELTIRRKDKLKLIFPWLYAVVLPNISNEIIQKAENVGIFTEGEIIGKETLESAEKFATALKRIPSKWQLPEPLTSDILNIIRGVLDPSLVLESNGIDIGTITVRQENLIKESIQLPVKLNQNTFWEDELLTDEAIDVTEDVHIRLVRGVAGSGKTLVLIRRAEFIANEFRKQFSNQSPKILITAYNIDLIDNIKKFINTDDIKITNFHKICRDVLNYQIEIQSVDKWIEENYPNLEAESGIAASLVADEIEWRKELEITNDKYLEVSREGRGFRLTKNKRQLINQIFQNYQQFLNDNNLIDWADIPKQALRALQNPYHPLRHNFNVILIDEAHDFAPSWISNIKLLLKPGGMLFMCDDPTQSIFSSYSWKQKGVEVVGRTRILRVPFRCTRQITLAAHSIVRGSTSLNNSEDIIVPDLESYELNEGERPILQSCRDRNDEENFVKKQVQLLIKNGLAPSQIAVLCHNKRFIRNYKTILQNDVYVNSFRKMKGLEFLAVFVPQLHTIFEVMDMGDDESDDSSTQRKLFTAMTRARNNLFMSYQGNFPKELAPLLEYVTHLQ